MVNSQDYIGKWAIVIGGSSGLGLATVQKLAREGMHICILHRTRRSAMVGFNQALEELQSLDIQVQNHNIDALSEEKRTTFINDFKDSIGGQPIKVVVHSIARGNLKPMYSDDSATLSNQDFKLTIDAMAINFYDWVHAFAKARLFTQDARAIAFTSEGSSKSWVQYGAVGAAKAALESITRGMAIEFASIGVKANCLQAGVTDTESLRMIPGSEQMKEKSLERNPYGRLTRPEDVANAVYLLCRDEATWINGCVIPVDGGEHIR